MNILIASGFFESELPSYREYSYSKELANLGHEVALMAGDQSQVWTGSRVKLPPTDPCRSDAEFVCSTGVELLRRKVLFRYSDFVLYAPSVRAILKADVVHVIEFRQGVTVLIALIAKLLGKPVIYDHEQRGDRTAKWYSRIDSLFRRALIWLGSMTVSEVRHTVLANRDHFRRNAARQVTETFAPLGTDPNRFFFAAREREEQRANWRLPADERCAVISGKLHAAKRVPEVVRACREKGIRLVMVGTIAADVKAELEALGPGNEIIVGQVDAAGLRKIYNAADVAIFTTFTLSYWEALATGLPLVVPSTEFTEFLFADCASVTKFGERTMFAVPDEEYKKGISIQPLLMDALQRWAREPRGVRHSVSTYSAVEQVKALSNSYTRHASST